MGIDSSRFNCGEVRLGNMRTLGQFSLGHSKSITQNAYPVSGRSVARLGYVLNLKVREGNVIDNRAGFSFHG